MSHNLNKLEKNVRDMEKSGQKNTIHHEILEAYLKKHKKKEPLKSEE